RESDRVNSFLTPALVSNDGRHVSGADQRLWRNTTTVEFRPAQSLTARWDFATLRDLRDYGDDTPNGAAAGRERVAFAGVDLGLERERNVGATLLSAPGGPDAWFSPRFQWTSGYSLLRDRTAPGLVDSAGDGELRLARRFGNSQRATAAAAIDLFRAVDDRV